MPLSIDRLTIIVDCVTTFGLIQGGVIWQCRLDASGESFLRRSDRARPVAHITATRLREIFASTDEPALLADAVFDELLVERKRFSEEVLSLARRFVLAWVCRLYRQIHRVAHASANDRSATA